MTDALQPFETRFEISGFHDPVDFGEVMMMSLADRDAIARPHPEVIWTDNNRAGTLQDDPVFVAIMIVRIDIGGLGVVNGVAFGKSRPIGRDREETASAKLTA